MAEFCPFGSPAVAIRGQRNGCVRSSVRALERLYRAGLPRELTAVDDDRMARDEGRLI